MHGLLLLPVATTSATTSGTTIAIVVPGSPFFYYNLPAAIASSSSSFSHQPLASPILSVLPPPWGRGVPAGLLTSSVLKPALSLL